MKEDALDTDITDELIIPAPTLGGGYELRSIVDIIEDLKQPIPEKYLYTKKKGSMSLTYWPWQAGVRAFNYYAPGWGWELCGVAFSTEGHVAAWGKLYVPCLEFHFPGVVRSGSGGDYEHVDEAKRAIGFDPILDAERQAMKRAMSLFSWGLDLYPLKTN